MKGSLLRGAALTLLLAGVAAATTLKRLTLEQVADRAREIVVATVEEKTAVPEEETGRIYTDVRFGSLETWKGTVKGSSITYRFAGGTIGKRRVFVPGVPAYKVGTRHVLFANPDDDTLCATVGWIQGSFRLHKWANEDIERVYDAHGHPVYGFSGGIPVLKPSEDRPRPLNLVEFQVEVTRALEKAERERRQRAHEGKPEPRDPELADDEAKRRQPPAAKKEGEK